jgi:hypothetical protein
MRRNYRPLLANRARIIRVGSTAAAIWFVFAGAQASDTRLGGSTSVTDAQTISLSRQAPAKRGAETVVPKSSSSPAYDPGAPTARKMGSSQEYSSRSSTNYSSEQVTESGGIKTKKGFGCGTGKNWAVVEGSIHCAGTLSLQPHSTAITEDGKELYIRAMLGNGFISGRVMRLSGDSMQMRVDMFGVDGRVASWCYLTQDKPTCHVGSFNDANPDLSTDPRFKAPNGQTHDGKVKYALKYASELVGGNLQFASSLAGSAMQDAYIASVTISNTGLLINYVGLHYLDGSQGAQKLQPIYSMGQVSWEALSGLFGDHSSTSWVLGSTWNANISSSN